MKYKEAFFAFLKKNKRGLIKAAVGFAILIAALFFYLIQSEKAGEIILTDNGECPADITGTIEENITSEGISEPPKDIIIDIGGAVAHPGVVSLLEGARVYEAVEKAGGLTNTADVSQINLAEIVSDGDKVWIPTEGEVLLKPMLNTTDRTAAQNNMININTADASELQTLKGVGPSTAEKIIDYRNSSGGFRSIEDLKNVSGIGEKTFEKLKNHITV